MRMFFASIAAIAAFAPVFVPVFSHASDMPHAMGADIMVHDSYARAVTPNARSGAAFMVVMNHADTPDRLIAASTDSAQRVELHSHIQGADGVMRMRKAENGFVIPAGATLVLERGGNHVMMMGLTERFDPGKTIALTLTFEVAGDIELLVPIDNDRAPAPAAVDHRTMDHSTMNHGETSGQADH